MSVLLKLKLKLDIPEPPLSGVSKVYILPVFVEEAEKNFYY